MADPVEESVISLGVELVIQTNATLLELARMPGVSISTPTIDRLNGALRAGESLLAGTHFSGDAKIALQRSRNPRAAVGVDALATAHHWLRVLGALYGPQPGVPSDG